MRIIVDMQPAQNMSAYRGIGRYTVGLAKGLIEAKKNHEVFLLFNEAYPAEIPRLKAIFKKNFSEDHFLTWCSPVISGKASIEENNVLIQAVAHVYAQAIINYKADVLVNCGLFHEFFICSGIEAIPLLAQNNIKVAIVCYDFIPLKKPDIYLRDDNIKRLYEEIFNFFSYADVILCISDFVANEASDFFSENKNIVAISSAAEIPFSDDIHAPESLKELSSSFIFYSGGIDRRKNVSLLIQAFSKLPKAVQLNYKLVISCSKFNELRNQLEHEVVEYGLEDRVLLLGHISDQELAWCYKHCKLFVFPSLEEGFGLTPLEAMTLGAPTIASNSTSLPEVIGLEEALFDPTDVTSLQSKMMQALTNSSFLEMLRTHAKLQSKKFSWRKTGEKAIYAFEKLNGGKRPEPLILSDARLLDFCKTFVEYKLSLNQQKELARCIARTFQLEI